ALAPYVAGLAKKLGIPGGAVTKYGTQFVVGLPHTSRFAVVAQGNSRIEPLHSIAVSAFDGEMIYHDTTMEFHKGRGGGAPPRQLAIVTARAWLTKLGWPGESMNVLRVTPLGAASTSSGEV